MNVVYSASHGFSWIPEEKIQRPGQTALISSPQRPLTEIPAAPKALLICVLLTGSVSTQKYVANALVLNKNTVIQFKF